MSVFKSPQHGNHYICQISVYKELHQFFPSPWGERVDLLCHNNQLFLERGVRPANFEWWMWLLLKNVSPNADWKLLLQIKGGGTPWGCTGRFGACGVSAGVFGEGDLSWGYVCSNSVLKNNQSSSLAGLLGESVHLPRWEPALYELSKTEVLLQIFTVERWQRALI